MNLDKSLIPDPIISDIMYFSPIRVGDERYSNQLYFQTEIYSRTWPTMIVDKLTAQIEELKHVELGIRPFDVDFKRRHREVVLFHCKMALAYLDAREARISMKLAEAAEAATRSMEPRIQTDPALDLDFLRVIAMSVQSLAARRVKFFQKAVDALEEAKNICMRRSHDDNEMLHPLLTALTLKNYGAVLGDMDHDHHALRWGLESLTMMYKLFSSNSVFPEVVEKYFLASACHNAALLNMKLGSWKAAIELVNEGIDFTKALAEVEEQGEGLRKKLIAVGAQARRVPERFFEEAVNKLNGWGEHPDVWNLSFWDFSMNELREEIHVLKHTQTLRHMIIEQHDSERRSGGAVEDKLLGQLMLAVVSCQSLEKLTVAHLDFDPHKVWRRIQKQSFLEKSFYGSALNFTTMLDDALKPDIAQYTKMMQNLNPFLRKVVFFLVVLGNECEGVDLSENGIRVMSITALVKALRWKKRPKFSRQVSTVLLRKNNLDSEAMRELAKTWDVGEDEKGTVEKSPSTPGSLCSSITLPGPAELLPAEDAHAPAIEPGVTSLDVSQNIEIGDKGLDQLTRGIARFPPFKVLRADGIGLTVPGCLALERLSSTKLEILGLSNNQMGSEGVAIVCSAALKLTHLHTLELDNCNMDSAVAKEMGNVLRHHGTLRNVSMNNNRLGSEGAVDLCSGAASSSCLASLHIAYNEITSEQAAEAISLLMTGCDSLLEMNLSGNKLDEKGAPIVGNAIENSRVLTMFLEDMGFTESTIDEFLDHGAAETQDLQVMILNNNALGDEGLATISECLSIGLTDLSLSKCAITAASQATLLNLVSLSPNMRSLDLSFNDLGPTGCADMVTWMTQNDRESFSLRSLELAGCNLGDEGFIALVPVMGALQNLGLRKNGITSAGLSTVMRSPLMIQLETMDLADNAIGEEGVHALTERFQQEHKRSLWNPKQLTSTVDRIILTNNHIPESLAISTDIFRRVNMPLNNIIW